jgi:hypothetical protein
MKRYYRQFRIMLLTLALGLASVPFYKTLREKWTEIRVDVPQIESNAPLIVDIDKQLDDTTLFGKRDLSIYQYGGQVGSCDNDKSKISRKCRNGQNKIKQFFWNNWNAKKLSYVKITDNQSIFIEPDKNGEWHIVKRYVKNSTIDSIRTKWIAEDEYETLVKESKDGELNLLLCIGEDHMCFGSF